MLIAIIFMMFAVVIYLARQLLKLRGEPQIYAEVAQELHLRAHELLVRKDKLETSLQMVDLNYEKDQWKNDLAQYMDDFEHEALQRRRAHLGSKSK
jgi:predicted Holliday junction resolvase-like endonuclease